MQIHHSLRQISTATFHSEHVKGHQDASKPGKPLPWKAQLNVRCDSLATSHLQLQPSSGSPNVPFMPASVAAVSMDDTTLTGNIPHKLRHHCGSTLPHSQSKKSQLDCLCATHNWTMETLTFVDWNCFNQATNKTPAQGHHHFCTRWVNHILPVMYRLQHRWNLETSDLCPSAGGQVETDAHLLTCPHPDRLFARSEFRHTIEDTFNRYHVDPSLRQVVKFFMALVDPTVEYNLHDVLPQYLALHRQQLEIGRFSLFYGFFHRQWTILQHDYLQLQGHPHDRRQAETLITQWARTFQTAAHNQWRLRNDSLHVDTPSSQAFKHTLLQLRICELYEEQDNLPEYDKDKIFGDISLDQRLAQSSMRQQAWIHSARKLIDKATQQAAIPPPGNRDIRSFLINVPPRGQHQGRPPGPPES